MSLVIAAPIEKVWASLADWESQGNWMLQTTVEVTSDIREGVGTTIAAFTGVGKFGVMDHMQVTNWEPHLFAMCCTPEKSLREPAVFN